MSKIVTRDTRRARSFGAHRLNVGITLLAVIFLIVMAAAAGVRASRPTTPVTPHGETLAVLGVAPGSDQSMPKGRPGSLNSPARK